MRCVAAVMLVALAAGLAWGEALGLEGTAGEAAFRAAWREFAAPAGEPEGRTLERVQQARLAALPHMVEAAEAEEGNADYQVSLAYMQLAAGQHEEAGAALGRAARLRPGEPLAHILSGQREAALARRDPARAQERVEAAMGAFSRAAELDPQNGLALLQAASVALEGGLAERGVELVDQALARPGLALYQLPAPGDLYPEPMRSFEAWQFIQLGHWAGLLARCQSAAKHCAELGRAAEAAGDLEAADRHHRRVLGIGRLVGRATPNSFVAVASGMDILEEAYGNLARVAEAVGSPEAQRWKNEPGVLNVGRMMLWGALDAYMKELRERPPSTIAGLLALEARYLSSVIAGIGLTPASAGEAR